LYKLVFINPKLNDLYMGRGKLELVSVAKLSEDLCIGVISQSSLVIAGSLRNISKYSEFIVTQGRNLFFPMF